MPIRRSDVLDADFVDALELRSDGTLVYLVTSVVSTSSTSGQVVINLPEDGEGLITGRDHPAEANDIVIISGTPGGTGDGNFTIASVLSDTSFTINETIGTSNGGGTATFIYPAAGLNIGFDPTGQTITTANNIQQALTDIANNSIGMTSGQHRSLRQLIHLADGSGGPFEGFTSGAVRVTSGGAYPTNITWYTDSSQTLKIVEKQITYNPNKTPATIYWAVYATDGTTVLATAYDAIVYNGAFEVSRTRTISDTPAPLFITAEQHKSLRQLIHLVDGQGGPFEGFTSGAFRETIGGAFPTSVTWYEDFTKVKKIVEKLITYTSTQQIDTVTWRVYDIDGSTVLATVTDAVTYSTFFETSRVRSIT